MAYNGVKEIGTMWIAYDTNDYGTRISRHICDTCGAPFTVCPSIAPHEVEARGWKNCLAPTCDSYDARRDVDRILANNPGMKLVKINMYPEGETHR